MNLKLSRSHFDTKSQKITLMFDVEKHTKRLYSSIYTFENYGSWRVVTYIKNGMFNVCLFRLLGWIDPNSYSIEMFSDGKSIVLQENDEMKMELKDWKEGKIRGDWNEGKLQGKALCSSIKLMSLINPYVVVKINFDNIAQFDSSIKEINSELNNISLPQTKKYSSSLFNVYIINPEGEKKSFKVPKNILAQNSEYFRSLIDSRETGDNARKFIHQSFDFVLKIVPTSFNGDAVTIKDFSHQSFELILQFIQSSNHKTFALSKFSQSLLLQSYHLSVYLKMKELQLVLLKHFLQVICPENVVKIKEALKYDVTKFGVKVREAIFDYMYENRHAITKGVSDIVSFVELF